MPAFHKGRPAGWLVLPCALALWAGQVRAESATQEPAAPEPAEAEPAASKPPGDAADASESAEQDGAGAETLAERAARLSAESEPEDRVNGALAQAERALERAHEARGAGDEAVARRIERIAEAALSLVERRMERQRARDELAYSQRRADELQAKIERAGAALRTERERLAELRASFEAQREATDAKQP